MLILTRFVNVGHEVIVSQVLAIVGGPMEWEILGPRGSASDTTPRGRWIVSHVAVDSERSHTAPLASMDGCVQILDDPSA